MSCTNTMLKVSLLKSLGRTGQAKWFLSFLRIGACAGSLELPHGLGLAVPGDERSVPGKPTDTVYGSLSHHGRTVKVGRVR